MTLFSSLGFAYPKLLSRNKVLLHKSRDTCQEAHFLTALFGFPTYSPSELRTARLRLEVDVIFRPANYLPVRGDLCLFGQNQFSFLSQWPDVPDSPLWTFNRKVCLLMKIPSLQGAHTCLESWVTEVELPLLLPEPPFERASLPYTPGELLCACPH